MPAKENPPPPSWAFRNAPCIEKSRNLVLKIYSMSTFRFMVLLLLAPLSLFNCGVYRFNDFQTDGAESIAIHYFDNKAPIVAPALSQVLTQGLKDKYRSESPLTVTNNKGDWDLSGFITQYQTSFLAVQADQPARTRLNMTVHVVFVNTINDSKSFDRDFSQFVDFDSSDDLSSVEDRLIGEITDKLIIDIYNATINNW
ncbi:hypothetical protein GC194_00955 [bacterium]|nr:hypothetical protein [bacterium]